LRIVFAGTPRAAVPALLALLESRHDVVGVVTAPDAPVGRRRRLTASPVAQTAADAGLPVLKTRRLDADARRLLASWRPELGVVVAFGALLPDAALAVPERGWINLHFSLLPRWRGAAPVAAAVLAGDDPVGFSIMRVVHDLDAGGVLAQIRVDRDPRATAGELTERFAEDGARALVDLVDGWDEHGESGDDPAEVPQTAPSTYAPKLNREDGRIAWTAPAAAVVRRILAMSPEPGAWCRWREADLKLLRAETAGLDGDDAPGDGVAEPGLVDTTGHDPLVRAGDGWVRLVEVQPAGKRAMRARDWAHGLTERTVLS
jgi:methionyl-tRNA formyltransferase